VTKSYVEKYLANVKWCVNVSQPLKLKLKTKQNKFCTHNDIKHFM